MGKKGVEEKIATILLPVTRPGVSISLAYLFLTLLGHSWTSWTLPGTAVSLPRLPGSSRGLLGEFFFSLGSERSLTHSDA